MIPSIEERKNTFIKKSKEIWGNFFNYDYVTYVNNRTNVTLMHDGRFFSQRPDHNLSHHMPLLLSDKHKYSTEEWISLVKHRFPDFKYDFGNVSYKNSHLANISLICHKIDKDGNEHGKFSISSTAVLAGNGCPKCKAEKLHDDNVGNKDDFVKKYIKKYGNINDFSDFMYESYNKAGTVICNKCGKKFMMTPSNLMKGENCPHCCNFGYSKEEKELYAYVSSIDSTFSENDRSVLDGLEIDMFSESLKIGIEFDGLFWHSERMVSKDYHLLKTEKSEKKGVRLVHVFEDEWKNKKEAVKSIIEHIIGKSPIRIYARKCEAKEISKKQADRFFNENSIKYKEEKSSISIGLFNCGELVSVMSFMQDKYDDNDKAFTMTSFTTKLHYSVVGAFGKLFKHFVRKEDPEKVTSLLDRRYFSQKAHEAIGFRMIKTKKPIYFYETGGKRYTRFGFQKKKNEAYKIYNCGYYEFEWKK